MDVATVSAPGGPAGSRFPVRCTAGRTNINSAAAAAPASAPTPNGRQFAIDSHPKRSRWSSAPSIEGHSVGGGSGSPRARAFATSARRSAIAAVQCGQVAACARTAAVSVAGSSPSTNADSRSVV